MALLRPLSLAGDSEPPLWDRFPHAANTTGDFIRLGYLHWNASRRGRGKKKDGPDSPNMAQERPKTANRRPKRPPRDDKGAPRGLPGEPEAAKIVDFYWLQRSFLAYLFILTFSNICLWSDRRACPFLNSCSHDLWVRTHTCSCDLVQGWGWLEPKRAKRARGSSMKY